jgi:hypothetical protein
MREFLRNISEGYINIPFINKCFTWIFFSMYPDVKNLQILTNSELQKKYFDEDKRINIDLWFFSIQLELCSYHIIREDNKSC